MTQNELLSKDMPHVVSVSEWKNAINAFRIKEKAATKLRDQLAAERRRLPMTKIEKDYQFQGALGSVSFEDLFDGKEQLLVYHFMYHPEHDTFCPGCSMFADQIARLAHLRERRTNFVLVSCAPRSSIDRHRQRMGWSVPWYSSMGSDFNTDFDVSTPDGETFGLSVFIRDSETMYRSYFTNGRGVEMLGSVWSFLDLTPLGRQEEWEDSPTGRPQSAPYVWWRMHDEY